MNPNFPSPPEPGAKGSPAAALDCSVLVPVLDEEGTVLDLARRVRTALAPLRLSYEIIFVDDGSRDSTCARVREARTIDPNVKLVRLRRNFGKAAALTAGFDIASGRLIVTLDGDLQDDPDEIPRMLETLEKGGFDLVSGWKHERKDPLTKTLPSLLFNWATRKVAQVDLHDFNCGFKVYRREVLEEVPIYGELHRYIPVLASRRGFAVGELAVTPPPAAPRGQQVRLGPVLQGPARPPHRALHHQVHAPPAAPLRRDGARRSRLGVC